MSVYLIGQIDIRDRSEYALYEAGFLEILAKYEGAIVVVSDSAEVLEGEWPCTRTAVLRFANTEAAKRWYQSDEYQKLAQHRFKSSTGNVVLVEGFPGA